MTELRWALLLAGALFVVGLITWELRKRRGDARLAAMSRGSGPDSWNPGDPGSTERVEPAFTPPDFPRRDPVKDPQLFQMDQESEREPELGDLRVIDFGVSERPLNVAAEDSRAPTGSRVDELTGTPPPLVVDWPPEDRRIILALRVVPRAGERFAGASLRQALVGEGFMHGEFSIFHKPLADGRVLLSAASLTRPGIFEPASMDSASFAGVNLFAVLPGPLAGREAFERLLLVGRTLAQRLRGELLDQRGQALDEARLGELRREAAAVPVA